MSNAQIHDLGYRSFDGERSGVQWAMRSLGVHAIQRVLGLKRQARHKLLPVAVILIAFVPAIIFVGMAAILPTDLIEDELLPTYAEYYGIIGVAIFLFASFVAPEALCTDRRTGMMALYLASPLNRTTYVVSKVAAIAIVLLTITLLPQIFLLLAYTMEGAGPDGVWGFIETLGRILLSGILLGAFYASMSAAISSMTNRRGIASASIVMAFLVPTIVAGAVLEATDVTDTFGLINLAGLPFRAATYLLGERPDFERGLDQMSGFTVLLVTLALTAAFTAFTWWRYQVIEVDR